jgi:hypothetical protein
LISFLKTLVSDFTGSTKAWWGRLTSLYEFLNAKMRGTWRRLLNRERTA